LAPRAAQRAPVFEHPLSATVGRLLALEETAAALDEVSADPRPQQCHAAALLLARQLEDFSPHQLGDSLALEIRRWTDHLDGLAHRPGVDGAKLDRLRSLLEQLGRRLTAEWPDYHGRLCSEPWLAAYRRQVDGGAEGLRPSPRAWAAAGQDPGQRVAGWGRELAPLRAAAEGGLRLMRDSLQRQAVACPAEGHELALPAEAASGLVRIEGPADRLAEVRPAGSGLRIRFLDPQDLAPASETVQATLAWFTL